MNWLRSCFHPIFMGRRGLQSMSFVSRIQWIKWKQVVLASAKPVFLSIWKLLTMISHRYNWTATKWFFFHLWEPDYQTTEYVLTWTWTEHLILSQNLYGAHIQKLKALMTEWDGRWYKGPESEIKTSLVLSSTDLSAGIKAVVTLSKQELASRTGVEYSSWREG